MVFGECVLLHARRLYESAELRGVLMYEGVHGGCRSAPCPPRGALRWGVTDDAKAMFRFQMHGNVWEKRMVSLLYWLFLEFI